MIAQLIVFWGRLKAVIFIHHTEHNLHFTKS